ncbi:MAG: type II toxin-antitoxin system PemK/MazF family toxin [Campylobacterota bacterium]|nr:type II toxin-antitoxin system PemK/MazF family toxin [Campylobacterota bacterium]
MTSFSKYDVVVVKFQFASSMKYKARPAIIISSDIYNENSRDTSLILAVSSNVDNKLGFELEVKNWKQSGLLKPSILKASVATVENSFILNKLGVLYDEDIKRIENFLGIIC